MSCYNPIAPSLPPRNVTVTIVHPGSLNISWLPPEEIGRNGPITGYEIQYIMVGSNETMTESVTSRNMYILTELFAFVNYSIEVAAVTINGTGPYSNPIIEESGHEGTYISVCILSDISIKIKCSLV